MHLHFLGIGSAYNTVLGNNNAWCRRGDDLLLIDCGESAFDRLRQSGLIDSLPGQIYVLLTHLHADHAGSLSSLCSYAWYKLGKRVCVVHPDDTAARLLSLMGIPPEQYVLRRDVAEAVPGLLIEATPVPHVPGYPSYGYLLTEGGEKFYYSGDAAGIPQRVLEDFLAGKIERLYQDAEWREGGGHAHHLSFSDLCGLIPPALRGRVTCMHLNRDYRAEAEAAGFCVAQIGHSAPEMLK